MSLFFGKRKEKKLEQQTKNRNDARRQVTERSQEMIKEVMAAVAQQNGVNSQAIQAAQQAISSIAGASSGGGTPQMISTSGGGSVSLPIEYISLILCFSSSDKPIGSSKSEPIKRKFDKIKNIG